MKSAMDKKPPGLEGEKEASLTLFQAPEELAEFWIYDLEWEAGFKIFPKELPVKPTPKGCM